MTITPKLSSENIDYVFSVAGRILTESSERLPSTPGEAYSARLILNELKNYCDEKGNFNAEIALRVLVKDNHPYWYVGLSNTSGTKALLLDGFSGEVLAVKDIF